MSKVNNEDNYLEKKTDDKKKKVKEQLLFGNDKPLSEKEKLDKAYQKNKLNE